MASSLLLYGGGIDSTACLVYNHVPHTSERHALFVRYGQKAVELEQKACEYFCTKYSVKLHVLEVPLSQISESAILSGSVLANDPSINVLDGRNVSFLSLAAMLGSKLKVDTLSLGYHLEPENTAFPDATRNCVAAFQRLLNTAYVHKMYIHTPFSDWTRQEIVRWSMNEDPEILEMSHTCYENVFGGCGVCTHCVQKTEMMKSCVDS